jgi:hypothetical protein
MASSNILAKMVVEIAAKNAEFGKAMQQSQKDLGQFNNSLLSMAKTVGIAFGVSEIAQFTLEIAKLAGEAEGVEAAFNKLPNSTKLMFDLTEATAGTVSELDLMKRSVQAANFGISMDALPKLLEFAALRAQQTGESVDYLVDSIVRGIGRKSPLILDNLGISAVALKEKLGGVTAEAAGIGEVAEAVGKIASEELEKMGTFSINTSSQVQKLSASWDNFKVSLGKVVNESGILQKALTGLSSTLNFFSGNFDKLSRGEVNRALIQLNKLREAAIQAGDQEEIMRVTKMIADLASAYGMIKVRPLEEGKEAIEEQIVTLGSLQNKLKELNAQFEVTNINDQTKLSSIGKEIIATQDLIKTLEELRKKQQDLTPTTKFGKETAANAAQHKTTDFRDFSAGAPTNPFSTPVNMDQVKEREEIQLTMDEWIKYYDTLRMLREQEAEDRLAAAQAAAEYGTAIGSALGDAISGQQSFNQAMKRMTAELIKMFLQRALAGIISSAASAGGPPPVAIALAAAGVAAISAMFNKIGASGSGGGAGGGLARTATQSATRNMVSAKEDRIDFDARFVIDGDKLVAVVDKTNKKNGRLNG